VVAAAGAMTDQLALFPTVAAPAPAPRTYVSMYDDLLKETAQAMLLAPGCATRDDLFNLLQEKLPQASPATRRVNAYKILERFFPPGVPQPPVVAWWPQLTERDRLQLLLYEFGFSDHLVDDFLRQVLCPLAQAGRRVLPVEVLHAFVTVCLLRPDRKSGDRLLRLLKKAGWVTVAGEDLHLQAVAPSWAVMLYCLHREFGDGRAYPLAALLAARFRHVFFLTESAVEEVLLQAWNAQFIIYETQMSPVGFRLARTLAGLTAAPPPPLMEVSHG